MPIVGLSDRDSVDPRFKVIGRIRKGGEKKGNKPGPDLDYFRFVPMSRDRAEADALEALYYRLYGKTPDRLEIYLPFDTEEQNFSSWREEYGANQLCKRRCSGARWHDWIDGDRHHHSTEGVECTFPYRDTENRCPDCPLGYYGRLSVILPEMWEADGRAIGLVTVMTTSVNDIAYLASKLVVYEPLSNKPFVLWREPERIGVPIKGKRVAKESNLLHLELREDQMRLEHRAGTRQASAMLAEQAGVVDAEFYTEEILEAIDIEADLQEAQREAEVVVEDEAPKRTAKAGKDPADLIAKGKAQMAKDAAAEAEELPDILIPPPENDWTTFFARCKDELRYDDTEQASVMKDRFREADPDISWTDLWHAMVEHQASKGHL